MLLDTKIQELITNKATLYEDRLDAFIKELSVNGKSMTRTLMMIDILYYLLEQDFTQDYINLALYKKLNHLLNTTEQISLSNEAVTPTVATASLTRTPTSIAFGSVEVGDESSIHEVVLTGSNLEDCIKITAPTGFKVSLYPTTNFSDGCVIFPVENSISRILFTKFVPLTGTSYSANITLASNDVATVNIACTGTGTVTP